MHLLKRVLLFSRRQMRGGGRRESVRKREEKQEKGEYGIVLSDAGEREKGG